MVDSNLKVGDLFIRYSKYDDERYIGVVEKQFEKTCIDNGLIVPENIIIPHNSNCVQISYSDGDGESYRLKKVDSLAGWTISLDELKKIVLDNGKMMKVSSLIDLYAKPMKKFGEKLREINRRKFGA